MHQKNKAAFLKGDWGGDLIGFKPLTTEVEELRVEPKNQSCV